MSSALVIEVTLKHRGAGGAFVHHAMGRSTGSCSDKGSRAAANSRAIWALVQVGDVESREQLSLVGVRIFIPS